MNNFPVVVCLCSSVEAIIFLRNMVAITPSSASFCLPKCSLFSKTSKTTRITGPSALSRIIYLFVLLLSDVLVSDCSGYDFIAASFLADSLFVAKNPKAFVVNASISVTESNSRTSSLNKKTLNPIIVIDNYDSFTYNLCQVEFYGIYFWEY